MSDSGAHKGNVVDSHDLSQVEGLFLPSFS